MPDGPLGQDEQRRLETLKLYDILDTLPEQQFDDITRLASEICQTSIALISFVDKDRQWFKSKVGLDVSETPRSQSFCAHAVAGDGVFEVMDPEGDARFKDNPLVTGFPSIRYYAGATLTAPTGEKLGTLCVINSTPHTSLTEGQRRSLETLARSVMSYLELSKQKKDADFFRNALDEISAVAVIDSRNTFEYANEKFSELIGIPAAELVGKQSGEVTLADISDADRKAILDSARNRQVYRGVLKDIGQNGKVSWNSVTVIPYTNHNNEIIKIFTVRVDMTERMLMLERFHAAERLLKFGSWEINALNGKRNWTRGLYEMVGFHNGEVLDSPTLFDYMDAEDKPGIEYVLGKMLKGELTESDDEVRLVTRDGESKIFTITSRLVKDVKGKVITITGTMQDVTVRKSYENELQESLVQIQDLYAQLEDNELKYRSLVEETSQMVYTTDAEGHYTYVSTRVRQVLGYADDEIIGKQFAFIYDDEWRKKTIQFYVQQLYTQTEETTWVFPVRKKSGEVVWLEQVATLVWDKEEIKGFRCVLHDITESVNTEEAMREAARLATEAKEMQQNFLSRMSHEIRTPMNGVAGMVNLLRGTPLSSRQKVYVDGISHSAQNMLRIINDILDISKIEAGKMVFEEVEFDIVKLVSNVVFTLKPTADDKGLVIAYNIDPKVPHTLITDPVRLNQVLLNLAGNALKFTEKGSVVISVDAAEMNDKEVTLKIRVADTGIGIAKDKLASVFESFTQAESSTTRKYGGTGLGLTIARQLIEQQGGEIDVDSELGRGTTFSFTFHCKIGEKAADENSADFDFATMPTLRGVSILLVEDNIINQMVAKHTLEIWEATVTIADHGRRAIELVKEHSYDIILMDIQMPEMSGLDATRIIRNELHITTPIIAMTASAMQKERQNCYDAGMNDYFSKPFEPADLNKMIHKHLGGKPAATRETLINIPNLMKVVDNDVEAAWDILEVFVDTMPNVLEKVRSHREAQNFQLLFTDIHNLKNSIGILGRWDMNEMLSDIEADINAKQLTDETNANLDLLEQQLIQLQSEAEGELKKR